MRDSLRGRCTTLLLLATCGGSPSVVEPDAPTPITVEDADGAPGHPTVSDGAPDAVVDWIRAHAHAIETTSAGQGFADLEQLGAMVGDAHVVALGEATHGTREFFELKHRFLEYLVAEHGFTAFAIDASMPEAFDVNRYVLTGEGDPAKALAGLYFWTWNTEEVLALIEWMRRWNADPTHEKKVKFYGFDVQSPTRAARGALAYLAKVDPRHAKRVAGDFSAISDPFLVQGVIPPVRGASWEILVKTKQLCARFDDHEVAWSARTGREAFAIARQHAAVLQQHLEMRAAPDSMSARDRAMAENVLWIREHEGPDARVVVWAHNLHVSTAPGWMGEHLRRQLGPDMFAFGFAFNEGSFQARHYPGNGELRTFTVGPAPKGTLDETFARAGVPIFALGLRGVPADGVVGEWFHRPHGMRDFGATFSDGGPGSHPAMRTLTEIYDGVLIRRVHDSGSGDAARPT